MRCLFGTNREHLASLSQAMPFRDPRFYQIATLGSLLLYGQWALDFELGWTRICLVLGTVLLTQWAATELCRLPSYEPRSALISGLSLCILSRTNSPALAVAGAVLAISSKFVLRVRGKHFFNPTNLALVALLLAAPGQTWVSPGQWGSAPLFAFALLCVGGLVLHRAARADVTLAFFGSYLLLLFGRSAWLGEPWTIPFHRLQSGSLLLFAFFMVSDPRTTPDSRAGRILFGCLVAAGAAWVQFHLFRTNGLLWSLAVGSCFVPLLNRLLPAFPHQWRLPTGGETAFAPRHRNCPNPPVALPNHVVPTS